MRNRKRLVIAPALLQTKYCIQSGSVYGREHYTRQIPTKFEVKREPEAPLCKFLRATISLTERFFLIQNLPTSTASQPTTVPAIRPCGSPAHPPDQHYEGSRATALTCFVRWVRGPRFPAVYRQ